MNRFQGTQGSVSPMTAWGMKAFVHVLFFKYHGSSSFLCSFTEKEMDSDCSHRSPSSEEGGQERGPSRPHTRSTPLPGDQCAHPLALAAPIRHPLHSQWGGDSQWVFLSSECDSESKRFESLKQPFPASW